MSPDRVAIIKPSMNLVRAANVFIFFSPASVLRHAKKNFIILDSVLVATCPSGAGKNKKMFRA